jgi:hypothetical protein
MFLQLQDKRLFINRQVEQQRLGLQLIQQFVF